MLVLMRRRGEEIVCTLPDGTEIVVTLINLDRNRARIGISAPREITVDRREIQVRKLAAQT